MLCLVVSWTIRITELLQSFIIQHGHKKTPILDKVNYPPVVSTSTLLDVVEVHHAAVRFLS